MEDVLKYRGFGIEVRALWSNEKSYFSLKRIERSLMFFVALGSQAWYIISNMNHLSVGGILALVTPLFAFTGYILNSTQKEKRANKVDEINKES